MTGVDRTSVFRDLLAEKLKGKQPQPVRKLRHENDTTDEVFREKEYMKEAYNILNHVHSLNRMLSSIRRPYLDVSSRSAPFPRQSQNTSLDGADSAWANVRHLNNEQRDDIDTQARTILSKCADRVKEMEALEKRRSELVASKTNVLARLLPARLRQDTQEAASSDFLAAHNASVTWYLSRRLTEASQSQKEMQEERVKRQTERTKTLGSGAAQEAVNLSRNGSATQSMPSLTGVYDEPEAVGSWPSSFVAKAIGAPAPGSSTSHQRSFAVPDVVEAPPDDEDDDIELTESQIQQFESENADMLRSVQDTLESVQQAEARLMDISALQMELVAHLTRQTELTDQLYEDAISATSMVEKGNVQLREARRRSKDSRLFILLFLIGASLSLLFLHYY